MGEVVSFGKILEQLILDFSNMVTSTGAAGLVSAGIILLLIFLIATYSVTFFIQIRNVQKIQKIIEDALNENEFKEKFDSISLKIKNSSLNKSLKGPKWPLQRAWDEYCETILHSEKSDVIRNTMRPSNFFNTYELGFERGLGRQWVNIFVTLGLFFTFLGIIAALRVLVETDASGGTFSNESMRNFLDAAKSKFIMSLTGLGASIVFNFVYRFLSGQAEQAVSNLCGTIENKVIFQTPEQIADSQLVAIYEQTEQLQAMANNLGAQIGSSVGDAVAAKLEPVLERVGASAGTEVQGLVGQLGDTIFEKLNSSLDEVSTTLNGVNRSMQEIAVQLQTSSNNVGQEMTDAVQSLSELMADARTKALQDEANARNQRDIHLETSKSEMDNFLKLIEENTRKGSNDLIEAAAKISEAAKNLNQSINDTANGIGDETTKAVEKIGEDAASKLGEAGKKVSNSIADATGETLEKLTDFSENLKGLLGDPLQTFANELKNTNRELKAHSAEIMNAANKQSKAAAQLDDSSRSLQSVSQPMSQSIEQLRAINSAISNSLEANNTLMTATKSSVDASMKAIEISIAELNEIVQNTENIDEKLVDAFNTITNGLNKTQSEVKEFTDQVTSKFAIGISSIQSVLDGLGDYEPGRRN